MGVSKNNLTLITSTQCYWVMKLEYDELTFLVCFYRIAYMINENSVQFNIVSKNLGAERMAFFLNEAAQDIRAILESENTSAKAKL